MSRTSIDWTDKVWNPVRGCSRVSPGCQNCYAERQAIRMANRGQLYEGLVKSTSRGPQWTGDVQFDRLKLYEPYGWKKPCRVFVNSMSDLFHNNLSFEDIACVFAMMGVCYLHTFQALTKRPDRALAFFEWLEQQTETQSNPTATLFRLAQDRETGHWSGWFIAGGKWPYDHIWFGVSAENQECFDTRVPVLLKCPAAIRWVSLEPVLGPIDLSAYIDRLDWVVVGGESGPRARACKTEWIESVVGQCKAAARPVFVKQLGEASDFRGDKRGKQNHPDLWPERLRVREFPA